jgi:hypothetical protein
MTITFTVPVTIVLPPEVQSIPKDELRKYLDNRPNLSDVYGGYIQPNSTPWLIQEFVRDVMGEVYDNLNIRDGYNLISTHGYKNASSGTLEDFLSFDEDVDEIRCGLESIQSDINQYDSEEWSDDVETLNRYYRSLMKKWMNDELTQSIHIDLSNSEEV